MKFKTLRYKKEFDPNMEFVHIENLGGKLVVYTCDIPKLLINTAELEHLKTLTTLLGGNELDFDKLELVEFDLIESGEIGADIRNKLTPSYNLIALLKLYFKNNVVHATGERTALARLIMKEMEKSKENIKYISNLL